MSYLAERHALAAEWDALARWGEMAAILSAGDR